MDCDFEGCTEKACACTSEWTSDESMVVRYWCKEHAPKDADFFNPKTRKIWDCGVSNGMRLSYANGGVYATPYKRRRKEKK